MRRGARFRQSINGTRARAHKTKYSEGARMLRLGEILLARAENRSHKAPVIVIDRATTTIFVRALD